MTKRSTLPPSKLIWRISAAAPQGEFVQRAAVVAAARNRRAERIAAPEVVPGGWVASSFDLLHGADITDAGDTLAEGEFDALFPSEDANGRAAPKA